MTRSRFISYLLAAATASLAQVPVPKFDEVPAIGFRHQASKSAEKFLPETMGAGVALLDFDNDGLLDVFFVNGALMDGSKPGPKYWNRLYRNNGNFEFTDITAKAGLAGKGYGMGAAAGDFNGDGRTDLYVTNLNGNILYRNNSDGTFTDVTEQSHTAVGGWSTGAAFLDYDRDGDLDLFVARYLKWDVAGNIWCGARQPGYRSYCHPDRFPPAAHVLLGNNGDGTFTDVSQRAGFTAAPGKGLGVSVNDFDGDRRPDIFVANDSFPQQLFRNRGGGSFTETALDLGLAYDDDGKTFAGMGSAFADYDNDGLPDIFVNALAQQRYALFRNTGKAFEYWSGQSKLGEITRLHSGWGSGFVDFDNDGWRDLFVAQGHVMDNIELTQPALRYLEPLLLLRNRRGTFENISKLSGDVFARRLAARGAVFGDLNNDGWIDIVVNVNDGPAVVLRNLGVEGHHWLMVDTGHAIGATVRVVTAGGAQSAYVSTAGSYLSASDPRVHFGLGPHSMLEQLVVTWPSGAVTRLANLSANTIIRLKDTKNESSIER